METTINISSEHRKFTANHSKLARCIQLCNPHTNLIESCPNKWPINNSKLLSAAGLAPVAAALVGLLYLIRHWDVPSHRCKLIITRRASNVERRYYNSHLRAQSARCVSWITRLRCANSISLVAVASQRSLLLYILPPKHSFITDWTNWFISCCFRTKMWLRGLAALAILLFLQQTAQSQVSLCFSSQVVFQYIYTCDHSVTSSVCIRAASLPGGNMAREVSQGWNNCMWHKDDALDNLSKFFNIIGDIKKNI